MRKSWFRAEADLDQVERYRINLQEKVSFVDDLVIIDRQNGQRPAHLGCHRNDVRGDVGVSRIDQNLGQKLVAEVKNQKSQKSPDHDMVLEPLEYSSRLHIFDQNRHQYRGTFIWYAGIRRRTCVPDSAPPVG